MKISVAMATYNGAAYLREQLDSIQFQSYPPHEVVISDDCSRDDTWHIIRDFAAYAPFPVLVHRNEVNLGYPGNFEQALRQCTGDLIFLCDQDDIWLPGKIEVIVSIAESDRHNMVFVNDAEITDESLITTGLTKLQQIRAGGMPDTAFVMGCCAAIRKRFLDLCLPIPKDYGSHDSWIMSLADGVKRRHIEEKPLQLYRRHQNNKSQTAANRTVRLSVTDYWLDRAKAVQRLGSKQSVANVLERTRMLRTRVESLDFEDEENDHELRLAFADYLEVLKQKEEAAQCRLDFCSRPRLARLWPAARLYAQGQYGHFTGITSMLRDILFK